MKCKIWRITWQSANALPVAQFKQAVSGTSAEDIRQKNFLSVQEYLYKYEYHPYLGQFDKQEKAFLAKAGKYHTNRLPGWIF